MDLANVHGFSVHLEVICGEGARVLMPFNVSVGIGSYTTIKVEDYNGEFHQLKRRETKCWVIWGLFVQAGLK